jgi:two-component system, OmpR family, sensor histidine kinase SenX3
VKFCLNLRLNTALKRGPKAGIGGPSPSLEAVTNTDAWLIFAVGFGLGAVIVGGSVLRIRRNVLEKFEQAQSLSDGAAELLEVLSAAALVLNSANLAVRATQGALAFGLLQNRTLTSPDLVELVNKARESNTIEALDVELTTGLSKDKVYITARAANIGDGNVLLIVDDRTESKRLDETRRDFIANISHELKTPIGAISLLAEALADAAEDPEAVAKFSKSLRKESKRLSGLIKDVIQLSRIQSAEIVTNAEIVDLSTVVMEAVDRNSFRAENRGLKISYDAPEGVEVVGDPEMLTVAVKNLIENAIIYSDEGASVGVGLRSIDNVAEITVTDSGIGIANTDQGRIFERFYRVDPSRSRKTGGTGLGLAIVKHVALSHNGEVKLFSKPGVGSTFTLRIPRADKNIVVSESERNAS